MHVYSVSQVTSPLVTKHGEVIYELLGRDFSEPTEMHSVAHVVISPGKASLLHVHPDAEESYYIMRGTARIRVGDEELDITPGQIVLIPPGKPHKISNIDEKDLEFLAVCVPAWEPENTVPLE
jgi:mannose-6-phosphate isomerase-like protein (cupin superfamily)